MKQFILLLALLLAVNQSRASLEETAAQVEAKYGKPTVVEKVMPTVSPSRSTAMTDIESP